MPNYADPVNILANLGNQFIAYALELFMVLGALNSPNLFFFPFKKFLGRSLKYCEDAKKTEDITTPELVNAIKNIWKIVIEFIRGEQNQEKLCCQEGIEKGSSFSPTTKKGSDSDCKISPKLGLLKLAKAVALSWSVSTLNFLSPTNTR